MVAVTATTGIVRRLYAIKIKPRYAKILLVLY